MSTSNIVTLSDRIITQVGEPAWDNPTVWFSESTEWLPGSVGYDTQVAQASLTAAQSGIDSLLAQQATLASQINTDAAMFAATPPGSTLTSEHIAALVRIVNGFNTTMQAIIAHLMLTGNAPPTIPLSLQESLERKSADGSS